MKNHNGIQVNEISEKTKASFRTRVITGLVLAAICVPAMIFGNWFFAALIFVVACIATYEFIHVLHQQKHRLWIDVFTFVMTISFMYWTMIKTQLSTGGSIIDEYNHLMVNDIGISTLGISFTIIILFFASMLTEKFNVPDVCYYLTMSILLSLGIQAFYFLRFVPISGIADIAPYKYNGNYPLSCMLFLYFIIGTCMSDIGAYGFGILFGKNKINPRISPNKTWEGFVGGIVVSFICSFTFGILISYFDIPLLKGILDFEHWYWILLASLIMPIASVIGDFIFSAIKRYYNIKDFSNVLPGHGGILDRIDSMLISAIVLTIFILTIAHFPFIK